MQATAFSSKPSLHALARLARGIHLNEHQAARARFGHIHSTSVNADTADTATYTSDGTSASSSPAAPATKVATAMCPTPQSTPTPATNSPATDAITSTKLALLEQVAALDRGTLATQADKENIERLVNLLEQAGNPAEPFAGAPAPIEGRWELLYTNKEVFRASPFFLAFQDGLVQNKELSESVFKFTDAIPGAEIGTAYQNISLLSGNLISEVQMTVFPGFTGTVITTSRAAIQPGNHLALTVESTCVRDSTFSPFLDGIAVPVERLINQVRGEGSTEAVYHITYVDATLRVTRAGDQLMVHRRVL